MLPSLMDPCRWLVAACLLVLVGCQAPSQPPPTSAAVQPTAAPPAATATRVESLNAANAAFKSGNLKDAASLYDRVLNTPPGAAESESAASAITDFARFRGMLTLLADGREDEARADLDALKQHDPSAPLARLADQLYNEYGMVGQVRGACAQLQPQVAPQAGPILATLQTLGVNDADAASLCTLPQG